MCVSIEIEIEENIQLGNGIIRVFEKNRMPAQTGIEFFHFIVWRNKNKHRKWSFYVARDVCSQWDYLIQSNFSMQTRNLRITLWRLRPDFFPFISCVEAAVISIFHRWQCCARYKMMELFFSLSLSFFWSDPCSCSMIIRSKTKLRVVLWFDVLIWACISRNE